MKTLFVTGYRAHELQIFDQKHKGIPFIKKAIEARITPLIEDGLEWVVTSGQYGVDLWACEVVVELKKRHPHLKLSVITAYLQPEQNWKEDKQTYFREIIKHVDYYAAVSNQPYEGVWQLKARDDLLLRKSDGILLFYDEDAGEASPKYMKQRALQLQEKIGYRYISITAEDVQSLADEEQHSSWD